MILGTLHVFQKQEEQWRWQARLTGEQENPYCGHSGLVSAVLDANAAGGTRLAVTGWGDTASTFRYQYQGQEWHPLETVTAAGINSMLEG